MDTTTVNLADQATAVTVTNGTTTLGSFNYGLLPSGLVSSTTVSIDPALSETAGYTKLDQLNALGASTLFAAHHPAADALGDLIRSTAAVNDFCGLDASGQTRLGL